MIKLFLWFVPRTWIYLKIVNIVINLTLLHRPGFTKLATQNFIFYKLLDYKCGKIICLVKVLYFHLAKILAYIQYEIYLCNLKYFWPWIIYPTCSKLLLKKYHICHICINRFRLIFLKKGFLQKCWPILYIKVLTNVALTFCFFSCFFFIINGSICYFVVLLYNKCSSISHQF